jgi:hypothetical protein
MSDKLTRIIQAAQALDRACEEFDGYDYGKPMPERTALRLAILNAPEGQPAPDTKKHKFTNCHIDSCCKCGFTCSAYRKGGFHPWANCRDEVARHVASVIEARQEQK